MQRGFNIDVINMGNTTLTPMITAGLLLLLFSMAFKVSAAPFHFWTPDVYDGAPTVFTSFMATIVKAAAFIAFLRLFDGSFGSMQSEWQLVMAIVTAATLFIGNITAVFQQSVKRMLAYSSIAQAGFMLFALVSLGGRAKEGLIFYAAAYCLATIGVFAILVRIKITLQGLRVANPTCLPLLILFSFFHCGIPDTAGLWRNFMLSAACPMETCFGWLYGHRRHGTSILFRASRPCTSSEAHELEASSGFKGLLIAVAAGIILLGIFPEWLTGFLYYFI